MPAERILIVEDESSIASAVAARLQSEGFLVAIASDGLQALELASTVHPDLIVLDLMLPGLDGVEVCRRIQNERPVPVLMLTARDTEEDLLLGLSVGADDYMTKPFSTRELVARIQAILRRIERAKYVHEPSEISFGNLQIYLGSRQVFASDQEVHITPIEFDLLACLIKHAPTVRTRAQLLQEVWGYQDEHGARTVDSHIRSLRRKLGEDIVRTVHGVGYAAHAPEMVGAK